MTELIWKEPEIYRIQIEIPDNPLRNANVYVLRSNGSALVVDAGLNNPNCKKVLWEELEKLQLYPDETVLFLTHFHADHIGQVWEFVKRGIRVCTGLQEYTYFQRFPIEELIAQMSALHVQEGFPTELQEGYSSTFKDMPMPALDFPAQTFSDGQNFYVGSEEVQVISVPGHTPGNTVLYLPKRQLLFSGDHILFDITPNIGVWPDVSGNLSNYLESLRKISRLSIRKVFPAHREMGDNIQNRIQQLQEHHAERLKEIQGIVAKMSNVTACEVAMQLHWSARGLSWDAFPVGQRWFAMSETLAHLYELMEQGKLIRKRDENGIWYYTVSATDGLAS